MGEVIPRWQIWIRDWIYPPHPENRRLFFDSSNAATVRFQLRPIIFLHEHETIYIRNFETSYYRTLIDLLNGGLSKVYVNGIKASFGFRRGWLTRRILEIFIYCQQTFDLRQNSQI